MLALCCRLQQSSQVTELTEAQRTEIMAINDRYANDGLRVLALAWRPLPVTLNDNAEPAPTGKRLHLSVSKQNVLILQAKYQRTRALGADRSGDLDDFIDGDQTGAPKYRIEQDDEGDRGCHQQLATNG